MLQPATLRFLQQLRRNNNKAWFDAHRPAYELARADVLALVAAFMKQQAKRDGSIAHLSAHECLFRINRDVRFSKNKDPYKTNFGAYICRGGKKSGLAGYYIHIEPGASFIGGGVWMPQPEALKKIRQEIDYNWDAFRDLLQQPAFRKAFGDLYTGENQKLSRVPRPYSAGHPAAAYLKLKSFAALRNVTDAELTAPSFPKLLHTTMAALEPLLHFLNAPLME
ncbi:MAG: DUF2461 domain-containing protein [Lacibacter sp.]